MSDESNNTELQPVDTSLTTTGSAEVSEVRSPKSRLCALLLGIFLGNLGVHNFYLGRVKRGLAQVIMTVFGFIFYFAGIILTVYNTAAIDGAYHFDSSSSLSGLIIGCIILILAIPLLLAPTIWSLVEWIKVACGKARDGQNRLVDTWVPED